MSDRTAAELKRIAEYEAGANSSDAAYLGAIWRRDWEMEAYLEELAEGES
jgi:hypothetical protein